MPRAATKNLKKSKYSNLFLSLFKYIYVNVMKLIVSLFNFLVPTEHGSEKKIKSKEFIDTVSESEDSSMSDQEEEDEDYNEESEEATSDEEGSDDNIEDDSGDDESPPVRSKSDTNRSGKSGEEKEDAKKAGMKRKAEKIREEKVKKIRSEKKTAASSAIKSADNKGKKIPKKSASEKEVQADPVKALPKKESKKESKKTNEIATESGEKNYPVFEEKNIDYNFVKNSSLNVVQRRCQIAPNIILQCKNVEFTQNGQQIDFASLTFSRKTKNGRAFDYNMPLSLAPVLIEAVQQIINDNAKFFASIQKEREKN